MASTPYPWEQGGYLPMDCPQCGHRCLIFDAPSDIWCEKCGRDEWATETWTYGSPKRVTKVSHQG